MARIWSSALPAGAGRRLAQGGFFALGLVVVISSSVAVDNLSGPVAARVIEVTDGDTLKVRAHIWLGQEVVIQVRLEGIDAPEIHGACADERALAQRARAFIRERVNGGEVVLENIRYGKYGGRVLARIRTPADGDLGALLLAAGLARAYDGGQRQPWCPG